MVQDPLALVTVLGALRLACSTVTWLAVLSRERARARVLVAALGVCRPGLVVDRRADGATLVVRVGQWPAVDRRPSEVWGE
jgi:hypothetical protein